MFTAEAYRRAYFPPKKGRITARESSITNSFVAALIPVVIPSDDELAEAFRILGADPGDLRCAYCGDRATEWDHLRPIVDNKRPTGHITSIQNLVPSCGKCNQSKGKRHWRAWMYGPARHSPKTRDLPDIDERAARLARYEAWGGTEPLAFADLAEQSLLRQHWRNLEIVAQILRSSQELADEIAILVERHRAGS